MGLFVIFILSIGLSVDVFFTLLVSPFPKNSRKVFLVPFLVAILHFILPILLYTTTKQIELNLYTLRIIPSLIFFYFGVCSLLNKGDNTKLINNYFSVFLLSFSVSLDSGFTGVSLAFSTLNIYLASISFGIVAFISSIISILISIYIKKKINIDLSPLTGIIFIFLSLLFFFNKL